jgi:hypothetical protein
MECPTIFVSLRRNLEVYNEYSNQVTYLFARNGFVKSCWVFQHPSSERGTLSATTVAQWFTHDLEVILELKE